MGDTPGARLRRFRDSLDVDQKTFAAMLGVSPGVIGFVERGERKPSKGLLEKLFSRFQLSQNWVIHGVGDMYVRKDDFEGRSTTITPPDYSRPAHGDVRIDDVDFRRIRRFDVTASAGNGALVPSETVIDQVAFTTSWLLRMGINGDLAGLIQVRGDSMSPNIRDGALALVHFAEIEVDSGHIYAFTLADELFIKRLTRIEGGYLVSSDNPAHPPYQLTNQNASGLRIRGRIRAVLTEF